MRAQEFLQQIKKMDALIENKLLEIERWKHMAEDISPAPLGERVRSSHDPQRLARGIGHYVDLEAEIRRDVEELVKKRKEILGVIEQLGAVEYGLLHRIYVQGLTLQDAADRYDRTYSWATTVHSRALSHVQGILDAPTGSVKPLNQANAG